MAVSYVPRGVVGRFLRQCKGKRKHGTKALALEHEASLRLKKPAEEFNSYNCPFCTNWHVGHNTRLIELRKAATAILGR